MPSYTAYDDVKNEFITESIQVYQGTGFKQFIDWLQSKKNLEDK